LISKAAKKHIDWMWKTFGDPSNVLHLAYVVRPVPPLLRGTASAHQCVVEAVKAARAGDHDLALSWLKAGQAHNSAAQREIHSSGSDAIRYVVSKYGKSV